MFQVGAVTIVINTAVQSRNMFYFILSTVF